MGPNRLTSILLEPHFSFRVRNEAARIFESLGIANPEQAVRTGGYRITTTLDYPLQQVARELVQKWVGTLAGFNVHNGALVAINSATGEIVAYVGSVDYGVDTPQLQGSSTSLRSPAAARVGLQADHLRVGLQGALGDRVDDVRRRHHRVQPGWSRRARTGPRTPTSGSVAPCWRWTRCATR